MLPWRLLPNLSRLFECEDAADSACSVALWSLPDSVSDMSGSWSGAVPSTLLSVAPSMPCAGEKTAQVWLKQAIYCREHYLNPPDLLPT